MGFFEQCMYLVCDLIFLCLAAFGTLVAFNTTKKIGFFTICAALATVFFFTKFIGQGYYVEQYYIIKAIESKK